MGPDWLIYIRLLFAFLLLLQPASACLLGCSMGKRGAEKFQNLQADQEIQSLQVPSSLHHYGFLLAESNDQILSVGF